MPGNNGIIFESLQLRNAVRVTAIDVMSGLEGSVVTPLRVSQRQRERLALKKLDYVMQRHCEAQSCSSEKRDLDMIL